MIDPLDVDIGSGAWTWNTQVPPPNSGELRTDTRVWNTATVLYLDRRFDDGTDASTVHLSIRQGDFIRLEHQTDPTRYARYQVLVGPFRVGDHWQYPVSYIADGGTLPNSGTRTLVKFTRAGSPASSVIRATYTQTSPTTWLSRTSCAHGTRQLTTTFAPGVLNSLQMVTEARRNHTATVVCTCPFEEPPRAAVVTFGSVPAVKPKQQRYVPQETGTLYTQDFFYGPPLACARAGAYYIDAAVRLSRTLGPNIGTASVLQQGVPCLTVQLQDVAGAATATLRISVNLDPNQSLVLAYDNLGLRNEDVLTTILHVYALWVPPTSTVPTPAVLLSPLEEAAAAAAQQEQAAATV